MSGGSEASVAGDGEAADNKSTQDDVAGLKQTIEQNAEERRRILEQSQAAKETEPGDQQAIERIFNKLSNLPYQKAKDITKYDGFLLSGDEKELNGILMTYIVIYYLPNIDLGKFCLWAYVILNIALLTEKFIVYADYKKKQKKIEGKVLPTEQK